MKPFAYVLGCSVMLAAAYEVHSAAAPADLHYLMKNVVAVQTQVIWDLGNRAQDDQGNPDASKLAAADWTKIMDAATKVRQASQTLARADHVLVAAPGVKIEGEGNPGALGAKQVQAAIDADPAAFRTMSQALAASMDQIGAAARVKDAAKLFEVSGALDQVCETCHMKFWYPEQKAAQ
jgi:cytochrome c556